MKWFFPVFLLYLLSGCSSSQVMRRMARSPQIAVEYPAGENRYQRDARYLAAVIRQAYPRLDDKIDARTFETETARLVDRCRTIRTDEEFAVAAQRFMALLKDGHSRVNSLSFYKKGEGAYPLRLFRENDLFLVSNIDSSIDSGFIGRPVTAVNGMPMDTILDRVRHFESAENDFCALGRFQEKVAYPRYWQALGVIRTATDSLFLTIRNKENDPVTVGVAPQLRRTFHPISVNPSEYPFTRRQNGGFFYKIMERERAAYLQMNTCLDYVAIKSEIDNYTNFFTKPLALAFLKKRTRDARNFGSVLQNLFAEIQTRNISTLILDLRNNTGGDERLGKQLIWYLTERRDVKGFQDYYRLSGYMKQQVKQDYRFFEKRYREKYGVPLPDTLLNVTETLLGAPAYFQDIDYPGSPFLPDRNLPKFSGRVYVLTGSTTFSAAQVLATTLQDNGLATVVGTPSGNKPSTQTGASLFKLPRTKLLVSISYLYMQRPDTTRNNEPALYPDVLIERRLAMNKLGHDEPFEWIIDRCTGNE